MKKGIGIILAATMAVSAAVVVQARNAPNSASRARAAKTTVDHNNFLSVGNLGALITNYGRFGDASTVRQSSMEWPLGSNNDYLYEGRLWFGTMTDGPKVIDSDNTLEWGTDPTADGDTIVVDVSAAARGDYDTHATFTDDFVGGLDNPIGLQVDQHTSTWTISYLDDIILYDMTFTNVSGAALSACYIGVAFDGDVSSQEGAENYLDDLTYYYRDDDLNRFISYEYDSDHPEIPGNDTGGPEGQSKGFIGTTPLLIIGPDGTEFNNSMPTTHYWWDWNHDPGTDKLRYDYMASGEFLAVPPSPFDYRYLQAYGPFDIPANGSVRIISAHGLGEGLEGLRENLWAVHDVFEANRSTLDDGKWLASGPPPAPSIKVVPGDGAVTVRWDAEGEDHVDPITGISDFAGYRVWRSATGVEGTWMLLADFDKVDDYGLNSGLPSVVDDMYEYVDEGVNNGFAYYYAVTVYDRGDLDAVGSLESSTNSNKVEVYPRPTTGSTTGDNIYVFPNPYRFQADFDPTPGAETAESNRVWFNNIPGTCTIRVFTMAGDLIAEIKHTDGTGSESWELMSDREQAQKVVSGIYLYSVRGEGVDFVDKFVILR